MESGLNGRPSVSDSQGWVAVFLHDRANELLSVSVLGRRVGSSKKWDKVDMWVPVDTCRSFFSHALGRVTRVGTGF